MSFNKIGTIPLFLINITLLLRISYSFPSSTNNEEYLLDDVNEAIKGTYFEITHCTFCNLTASASVLGKASEYTKFYLYTRDSGENYTEIIYGNVSSITESAFDIEKPTKILIHGWLDSPFREFGCLMREAYQSSADVNLVHVDWSALADTWLYPLAWAEVGPVGKFIAELVDWLVTDAGVSIDDVHVIGHSLGGQIAGAVGEHVTVGQLGRISGLDPAGPGFGPWTSGRLDSSDAQFVDVIHTCGGWSGYYAPSGHVDFYPNRGVYNQPGCPWDIGGCSHLRVYHLFAESVGSQGFVARECDSWKHYVKGRCDNNATAVMGEHVSHSVKGKFYLHTAGSSPFALGNSTETKM